MFAWIKSLLGRGGATPTQIARAKAVGAAEQRIQARYDNAQFTDENQRNWFMSDWLSAKSANDFQVRRQLRIRSRYEVSNNPYLYGVCTGNADDLISTGPTLKCTLPDSGANKQIERTWNEWAAEVELKEKLRTCKLARTVDGEGFLILKTVADMEHPVKLYPVDCEADQVTTPVPKQLVELWVDGLTLHPVTGRPVSYDVLRTHPGDFFFPGLNPLRVDKIKARFVVHWFPKFRPGQVRGVPIFTSALDMFAELRAYRKAVLQKAQVAANLTAVLESEAPADYDGSTTATPFETIPIDRGTMTTLPANNKLHQYQTGDPGTTYEMFQEKCLGEAIRPLAYPLNLALGTSQKFNFSSARLDYINYRNALNVERADCDTVVMDKLLAAFVEEAALAGILPGGIRTAADIPHEWHWPGFEPLDPVADAQADHARLSNGTVTYEQFWASRGYDWRQVMAQQSTEAKEIEKLGLVFGDPLKKTDTITEEVDDGSGDSKPGGKNGKPDGGKKGGKGDKGSNGGGNGADADDAAKAARETEVTPLRRGAADVAGLTPGLQRRIDDMCEDAATAAAKAEEAAEDARRATAAIGTRGMAPDPDDTLAEWGRR